jgi:hypothetical protein
VRTTGTWSALALAGALAATGRAAAGSPADVPDVRSLQGVEGATTVHARTEMPATVTTVARDAGVVGVRIAGQELRLDTGRDVAARLHPGDRVTVEVRLAGPPASGETGTPPSSPPGRRLHPPGGNEDAVRPDLRGPLHRGR